MKVKKYFLAIGLFVVFLAIIMFASASFDIGNQSYSIQENYLEGSYLSGWLNISFEEMPTDSLFTDSFENNIPLQEVLDLNENYNYVCDTADCASNYLTSSKELTKSFVLNEGESKIIGFKLKNQIQSINSFSMDLQSDAGSSCYNQISVDFFDNGLIETSNNKSSSSYCRIRYGGCYPTENATIEPLITAPSGGGGMTGAVIYDPEEILLTNTPLCQKIQFPEAPKIGLGAWVKETEAGNKKVVMGLFDLQGNLIDDCNLSKLNMVLGVGKRIACSVDFRTTQPEEYYVCVHTQGTSGEYKTRGFIPENDSCGFIGYPPATPTSAYDLFVQGLNFAPIGTLNIGNTLQNNQTLGEMIGAYILKKYGSLDCSDDCLIPVKISSKKNQIITLSNVKLKYNKVGLGVLEEKYIYDFEEVYPKINSSHEKLFLDNLFLISGIGIADYFLFFENQEVINQEIQIESIEMNVNPTIAAAEVPITFRVVIYPSKTIEKYEWDFGDGKTKTTTKPYVEHTYEDINNYELIITAIKNDTSEEYTKIFNIEVKSPETLIPEKIADMEGNIENLRLELNNLDSYAKQRITNFLDLDEKESQLNELKTRFEQAENEQEFVSIAKALFALEIPDSMIVNGLGEITVKIKSKDVNVNTLTKITGENYSSSNEQNYINSILKWYGDDFKIKGSTKKVYFKYGELIEPSLSLFNLRFEKKGSLEPYFIIEDLENLNMNINYSEMQGSKYIQIKSSINSLKIDTTQDIEITDLAMFVSPRISELSIINVANTEPKPIKKEWFLWVIIIIVGISLIFAYFGIKNSYKAKVENSLFKDKTKLPKMMKYIDDEQNKGISNEFIKTNLKKAGWNTGQIKYAMKAHSKIDAKPFLLFSFIKKNHKKVNKDKNTK